MVQHLKVLRRSLAKQRHSHHSDCTQRAPRAKVNARSFDKPVPSSAAPALTATHKTLRTGIKELRCIATNLHLHKFGATFIQLSATHRCP